MGGRKKQRISSSCDTEYFEEEMELEEVVMTIVPKSDNQRDYNRVLYSISKPMVFAVGPAGTGKTMLACCAAIQGYNDRTYKRIVLTRPVVSVEEDIGFLPGTMEEKMDPWTRPIMDIFAEYYTQNDIQYMIKEKIIEICPLAYMRGRTFKNCWIVADEMQNSTINQMKMLMTRLGENSRLIVTGDLEQYDRINELNGLDDFLTKFKGKRSSKIGRAHV